MFVINISNLSLKEIYASNQCPSWRKVNENKYIVSHRDRLVSVQNFGSKLAISCSEEDFFDIWYPYFDMPIDYSRIIRKISNIDRNFNDLKLKDSGMRILQQDTLEMLYYSLFRSWYRTDIFTANYMYNLFKKVCGIELIKSVPDLGRHKWYILPEPEDIIEREDKLVNNKEREFEEGLIDNIIYLSYALKDGDISVEELKDKSYEEVKKILIDSELFDDYSIEWICMSGLGIREAFPRISNDKADRLSTKVFEMNSECLVDWYDEDLIGLKSYLNMYMNAGSKKDWEG